MGQTDLGHWVHRTLKADMLLGAPPPKKKHQGFDSSRVWCSPSQLPVHLYSFCNRSQGNIKEKTLPKDRGAFQFWMVGGMVTMDKT